jgi:transcriptional regulator with XRE-family HTH domain
MARRLKHAAPDGFIAVLRIGMETRRLSLNQLAERAGVSPAFLSRILNRQRGLPSDPTILRLAQVLDVQPPERLLIEAGRIPAALQQALSQPQMPELLRAAGTLSEADRQDVIKSIKALALKQHRRKRP